jgi:hypothetical protein
MIYVLSEATLVWGSKAICYAQIKHIFNVWHTRSVWYTKRRPRYSGELSLSDTGAKGAKGGPLIYVLSETHKKQHYDTHTMCWTYVGILTCKTEKLFLYLWQYSGITWDAHRSYLFSFCPMAFSVMSTTKHLTNGLSQKWAWNLFDGAKPHKKEGPIMCCR